MDLNDDREEEEVGVSMMIEMVSTVIVKCRFVISDEKYMF
jgi:hypothetical protein